MPTRFSLFMVNGIERILTGLKLLLYKKKNYYKWHCDTIGVWVLGPLSLIAMSGGWRVGGYVVSHYSPHKTCQQFVNVPF